MDIRMAYAAVGNIDLYVVCSRRASRDVQGFEGLVARLSAVGFDCHDVLSSRQQKMFDLGTGNPRHRPSGCPFSWGPVMRCAADRQVQALIRGKYNSTPRGPSALARPAGSSTLPRGVYEYVEWNVK